MAHRPIKSFSDSPLKESEGAQGSTNVSLKIATEMENERVQGPKNNSKQEALSN